MLFYPQLSTGAPSQFPIVRRRRLRTIVNRAADARSVKLADPAGGYTEWTLEYAGLTDDETASIRQLFALTEGSLQAFIFIDPIANLLAWSDKLDEIAWTPAPLLALTSGISDPRGGVKAWRLDNPSGGAQSITQTLQSPGDYVYCVSAYARSSGPVICTLLLDTQRAARKVTSLWTRLTFAGTGAAAAESVGFGFEVPAGTTIEIFGMQVEAQPAASPYHPSTAGGVYPDAHFRDDVLALTATGVGQHACTVNIIHADHI